MAKPALLIIDMCRDFFINGRLYDLRPELVRGINELTGLFRGNGLPIIWVRQEFEPDLSDAFLIMRREKTSITIKGSGGEKLLPELDFQNGDIEIIKKRYSAFYETALDSTLEGIGPTHLVLAGVNTHACIRTAAVDAYQRDYEVALADEGINSYDPQFHEESKRYLEGRVGRFLSNAEIRREFALHA